MAKKRRSRQFKDSSQVIDIEEAREKRQQKREKQQSARAEERAAARKAAGRRHKRNKWGRALIYAVIIVLILAVTGASAHRILSLKQQQREAQQQQQALKDQSAELKNELKDVNNPSYIEEQARIQLRLIMPGERIFVFPTEKQSEQATNQAAGTENAN